MRHRLTTLFVSSLLITSLAYAGQSGDELWILAAGRGPGAAGSFWVTDLHVMNVTDDEVEIEISLLLRSGGQLGEPKAFTLAAKETLTLADVIDTTFGGAAASGAIHIEVVEDDETADIGDDVTPIVAHARIYDRQTTGTMGQSLEGMPSEAAISADSDASVTHIAGVTNATAYRANWFGVALPDEDDQSAPAVVLLEVLSASGDVIASKTYAIAQDAPSFQPLSDVAPSFENATLRFTMEEGTAMFGVSMIDMKTNDPTTLEAHWSGENRSEKQFADEFHIEDCTFSTTAEDSHFPLIPGMKLVLEGEDDSETIRNTIEVTGETVMIDGVVTRVVTETELADGELVERSRNFFARCVDTGSIFYFGEEVDIYDDGEIVSHAGAWRAGVNGARPGIIMPGVAVPGARYYQEVAPEVALDRAEHLLVDLTITTPAGTFDDCMSVRDTTPLEPGTSSFKVYCRGIGLVHDSGTQLVSYTIP